MKFRSNLINGIRTPLMIVARKSASTPEKLRIQQSDYAAYWQKNAPVLNTGKTKADSGMVTRLKQSLYRSAPRFTRRLATLEARSWSSEYTLRKPQVFRPLAAEQLVAAIRDLKTPSVL
jgi:hypothetical protein